MGVNNSGCDPRLQDHYEPLPRGGTDASVASCIAPPSTTVSTYRCKMCARARVAVGGVHARIRCAIDTRSLEKYVFQIAERCAQQHLRPQRKHNAAPPRGESLLRGTRNAHVSCGARTTARGCVGRACICRASLARATRDVPTSRARVPRCACRACDLRASIARATW